MPVSVEFWPLRFIRQLEAKAVLEAKPEEPACYGMADWPEPVRDGTIGLGPVIYESFATALDLYPRKEGAHFARHEEPSAQSPAEKSPGPFLRHSENSSSADTPFWRRPKSGSLPSLFGLFRGRSWGLSRSSGRIR